MNSKLNLQIGEYSFILKLEWEKAPETCKKILTLLPLENKIIQARWSGDAGWVPLGALKLHLPSENKKNAPLAGEILVYSGEVSETEIYVPYGFNRFACKEGQLEGNHFATIVEGVEKISEVGKKILHQGAQVFKITK